jgi:glycerol-3-phosphate acyltransferase PlsY
MALLEQLQSVPWARATACGVGAYLLGCLSTGYYLVRARTGRDIRQVESGATGARNVSRVLGTPGFILTVLGDFAKGALAVWAAGSLCGNDVAAAIALLAVVSGHLWPVQLRFRGGKGVATSLAGLLVLDWRVAVAYAVIFGLLFLATRRTILPGLFAYCCLPFVDYGLDHDPLKTLLVALMSLLVLVAHRNNLVEEIPPLAARRHVTANPEKPKL